MIGPIPVLGHFHPYAGDYYGFRRDLVFTVLISPNDYSLIAPTAAEAILEKSVEGKTKEAEAEQANHGFTSPVALLEWMCMEGWCPESIHHGAAPDALLKDSPPYKWALEMLLDGKKAIPYNTVSLTERNLAALPQAMMEKYQMVCYHRIGDVYYISSSNPSLTRSRLTGELNARIGAKTGRQLDVVVSMAYDAFIEGAIRYLMSGGIALDRGGVSGDVSQEAQNILRIDYDPSFTRPLEEGMEPPEVLKWILFRSISMKASDIHIQEGEEYGEVRVRVNGALTMMASLAMEEVRKVLSLIKLSSDLNVAEKRMPQDGRFSVELKGQTIDARVSTGPVHASGTGESCVIRLINKQTSLKSIQELELPSAQEEMIRNVLERRYGLILVTGPTGSGKTSSLYAFLNEINSVEVAIVTIEDPVEILLPRAKQLQVNNAINLTFARLLRSVLRHDPDIIMVGEIRDKETADHAIQAAQTGHLVFATLHTNDALRAIPRMEALGIDRNQLANSLLLVQAQRLIRCVCPNCRKGRKLDRREHEVIMRHLPRAEGGSSAYEAFLQEWNEMIEKAATGVSSVYDPVGCLHCNQTGYNKRRAVMEIFPVDDYMRDMIENGANVGEISEYVKQVGLADLALESLRSFLKGDTTFHEIQVYLKI
jgi:type II secretory ATPase GspE/PulE/Tfp pilus assembly ATPase PilB-like protein